MFTLAFTSAITGIDTAAPSLDTVTAAAQAAVFIASSSVFPKAKDAIK